MQTKQETFLEFLSQANTQFNIPHYQRAYAWTERQCDELFVDIMRAGRDGATHFMSMVLFLDAGENAAGLRELDIIDGQQRIATMTIMLSAFEGYLRKRGKTVEAAPAAAHEKGATSADGAGRMDADAVARTYLEIPSSQGPRAKIRLQGLDGLSLDAVVCDTPQPAKASQRIVGNRSFFEGRMGEPDFDPEVFWRGVGELLVIDAQVDEGDKAQAIFESLNTKGLPLTTADLVRNYLLVGQTRDEQERLYREYWNPIELMFGEDRGSLKLNAGIRMWLSIRFRGMRIHDKSQTYNAFKRYMTEEFDGTTDELLDELRGFCLMWAENYKFNEVKEFRCMDWANGKSKTLLPGWGHQSGF